MNKCHFISFIIPILFSFIAQGNDEVIKKGLKLLTTKASQGPSLSCEDERLALSDEFYQKGADCSDFIERNGGFGDLGKTFVSHAKAMGSKALFYNNDIPGPRETCPNWRKLTVEEKAYYWIWFFAAISWKESTCGVNTVNKAATHGVAVGMFQLNQNVKDRYWRGGVNGKSCAVKDIRPHDANLKCGMEILNELLKGKKGLYMGSGALYGRSANSYWEDLRKADGGQVMMLMRRFPLCK